MTIAELNTFLANSCKRPPFFVFITGASGAGKTFLAKNLKEAIEPAYLSMNYFDAIGVPSTEEMIRLYGSPEKWQEVKTREWIQRLAEAETKPLVILEGQYNPLFVIEGCRQTGFSHYLLINLYANRKVRENRLFYYRHQPELIHDDMENWAQFLKKKTLECGGISLDTSDQDIKPCLETLTTLIREGIKKPSLISF